MNKTPVVLLSMTILCIPIFLINSMGIMQPSLPQVKEDTYVIKCKVDFVKIIRVENHFPVCVKPMTASKLILRGWGSANIMESSGNSTKVIGSDTVLNYNMTGGKLLGIIIHYPQKQLIITINSETDGILKIVLPRNLIDVDSNNKNDTFYMAADGKTVEFNETATPTDRIFVIHFKKGDNEIFLSVFSWLKNLSRIHPYP